MDYPSRLRVAAAALAAALSSLALAGPFPLPQPDVGSHTFDGSTTNVVGISPTGNVYVSGNFTTVDGQPRNGIARLKADGSLDAWAPTLAAMPGSTVHLAVEDAAGNVAIAAGNTFEDAYLQHIPAATQAGVLVDGESINTGRRFMRLAFDGTGALYAAVSRDCNLGLAAQPATVRKYTAGTAIDPSFELALSPYDIVNESGTVVGQGVACVAAVAIQSNQVYVGGRFGHGGLLRAATANGAVDVAWKPLGNSGVGGVLVAGDMVYAGGSFEPALGSGGLRRFFALGTGERDTTWNPAVNALPNAEMVLDASANHLYFAGTALDLGPSVAVDTVSGAVVATWDPAPERRTDFLAVRLPHLVVMGDRLLIGGNFTHVGGEPRPGVAALPLASAPVTWPVIATSATLLDFGTTFTGGTRSRTFTVSNVGAGDLVVQGFYFYVPDLFTQTNTCEAPVPPGGSCTVTVAVTLQPDTSVPSNADFFTAVAIASNGGGTSVSLYSGFGNAYEFVGVSNSAFEVAPTPVGSTRTIALTVRNLLPTPLVMEGARIFPYIAETGEFSQTNNCAGTIPVGGTCVVTLRFTPLGVGLRLPYLLRIAADASGPAPVFGGEGIGAEGDLDGDGMSNSEEMAYGRDPSVKDNDVFTDATLFAAQQYRDFLGRTGDAGGIAFWAERVAEGSLSRVDAIAAFMGSGEFEAVVAPVTRLYLAYFLRIPDYQGLDFWIRYHRGGNALESISNLFAQSPEFQSLYGVLDDAQFVDRAYRNVLGRAPDAPGLAFWTGQLAGGTTRGQVMVGFSESAEYRDLTSNEVFVTMVYAGMLRRAPDSTGYSAWVNHLDGGNSRAAVIGAVMDSLEYRARFLP